MNEQLEVNLDDSDSILLLKFRAEGVGLEVPTQGDLASLWGMAVAGCVNKTLYWVWWRLVMRMVIHAMPAQVHQC